MEKEENAKAKEEEKEEKGEGKVEPASNLKIITSCVLTPPGHSLAGKPY